MKRFNPEVSLQQQFAAHSICFGCGPANPQGLQLESYLAPGGFNTTEKILSVPSATATATTIVKPGGRLIATYQPRPHHVAFEGVVNGGILSALLDCHLNWTAAWHLMLAGNLDRPPGCVTAKYEVTFKAPTPIARTLRLEAWLEQLSGRKAVVCGRLGPVSEKQDSLDLITATAHGTFVAVKPDHPAYHRW